MTPSDSVRCYRAALLLVSSREYEISYFLGIFVPLIVTNCAIIGRAEAFASKNRFLHSTLDGLMMGLGFTVILVILGAVREVLGYGTVFRHADLMLGEWAAQLSVTVLSDYKGLLFALLPPGAFMGLAVLIALKNKIDRIQIARQVRVDNVGVTLESKN